MKVLREGREQAGWSVEARCTGAGNGMGGCGALLLVEEADVYQTQSQARDSTVCYPTFRCSECGILTDLDPKPPRRVWAGKVKPVTPSEADAEMLERLRAEARKSGWPSHHGSNVGWEFDRILSERELEVFCAWVHGPAHTVHTPPEEPT